MGGHAAETYWEGPGLMKLMSGLLIAPAAWFLDLQVSYAAVKWACADGHRWPLLLVPAGTLALIALSSWLSWSSWTRLHAEADLTGGREEDRSCFLALSGLGLSAVFALLTIVSFAPRYWLSPCE
jgi:hypothetical protein